MEATIGFDLRSIVSDPSWTADRRARHLLRHDVRSVRSVDPMVWERPPGLPPSPEPAVTDRRVPEHAPFYGYGIYQLFPHELLRMAR